MVADLRDCLHVRHSALVGSNRAAGAMQGEMRQ